MCVTPTAASTVTCARVASRVFPVVASPAAHLAFLRGPVEGRGCLLLGALGFTFGPAFASSEISNFEFREVEGGVRVLFG